MSRTAAGRVAAAAAPPPTHRRTVAALAVAALTAIGLATGVVGGVAAQAAAAGHLPGGAGAVQAVATPDPTSTSDVPTWGRQCLIPPVAPGTAMWVLCWWPPSATPDGPWEVHQLIWDGEFVRVSGASDPRSVILGAPRPGLAGTFFVRDTSRLTPASDLRNEWSMGGPVPTPTNWPTPTPTAVPQPSAPAARPCGTTTAPAVCWNPVTTYGSAVVRYDVFRKVRDGYERVARVDGTTTRADLPGLAPGDHVLHVAAFDDARGVSPVSAPVRVAVEVPQVSCDVRYRHHVWGTGFTSDVTITNTGATPVEGWTLRYDLVPGPQVTGGWNATWAQSGATVTAANAQWNAVILPGGSVTLGALGTRPAGSGISPPNAFTLDGAACTTS
ncbi:cellulose binding domain-containing protein [Antribacter gilvus]|uniref:cellulose binding domain-containing protein n=1 Tax=Antribacter gilvus TaxID=2304675 RepID=UPI000F7A83DA|nr:cellulose binding domain-containing protein [Antribacter gilvus]